MLSKEEFDNIYSVVPRVCVEILVLTENGFVLSKRLIPPGVGMWHIPGGTVFLGERLNKAAERVGLNELGIKINILSVVGVIDYLDTYDYVSQSVSTLFFCTVDLLDKNKSFKGSFQAEEIKEFHVNEIPENTIRAHKIFFDRLEILDKGDNGIFDIFEYMEE